MLLRSRVQRLTPAVLFTLLTVVGAAGVSAADSQEDLLLDEVLVTGERPGPAMWKVSKGDHTLWIMGTLTPLPAKMSWKSREAEAVIGRSGEILADSTTDWDAHLGFWESIGLIRAALKLRHNADGSTLRKVLPPDVYDRWHTAHQRWFGKNPDPGERARPSYAAALLYERALKASGLVDNDEVWSKVDRLAKRSKVKIRQRSFPVEIEDPKGIIAELKSFPVEKEVACLVAAMDYIDQELPDLKRRAQAWATGNVAALRALPEDVENPACEDALINGTRIGRMFREEQERFREDWSGIVDWLLLTHETSFTLLPVANLLAEEGPLAQLRAKGYTVEEPL